MKKVNIKKGLRLLITIFIIGCQNLNPTVNKFRNYLPPKDLMVLEKMVDYFDELIMDKYNGDPSLFWKNILDDKAALDEHEKKRACELLKEFEESTLEYKSEKLEYDTVYASNYYKIEDKELYSEEPVIMTVTQEQDTSWDLRFFPREQTIEENINEVKKEGYWNYISKSSFVKALIASASNDEEVKEYIEARNTIVKLNYKNMVQEILDSKIDTNDYFIKRIVVFEILSKQVKEEYGC